MTTAPDNQSSLLRRCSSKCLSRWASILVENREKHAPMRQERRCAPYIDIDASTDAVAAPSVRNSQKKTATTSPNK